MVSLLLITMYNFHMKKQLEELSKDELIKIAERYSIYGVKSMNKKELIRKILDANGIDVIVKEKKQVKLKKTNSTKLQLVAFSLLILAFFVMTFSQFFNSFYYDKNITGHRTDYYFLVLSVLSFGWSMFVFRSWLKSGEFNVIMIAMMLLSIGWFIYQMIGYHKQMTNLKAIRDGIVGKVPAGEDYRYITQIPLHRTMFYVWIGTTIGLMSVSGSLFAIQKILYK